MKKNKKGTKEKDETETLELKNNIQLSFEALMDPEDNDNLRLIIMRQPEKDTN